jgi:beta-1,4-mannosyl-glycoprotein beta-1,4-N-acetylglucosaminyltransferase
MALPVYQSVRGAQRSKWSPLRTATLVIAAAFTLFLLYQGLRNRHDLQDTFSYSTRPLWDKPDGPTQLIPHLHAEGVPADDSNACARHGWAMRSPAPEALVDVFLFSTELDLLEIRLRELWDVVDRFVLVESTHTLMGEPKNLTFAENRAKFAQYESKISYSAHQGRAMQAGDGAFTLVIEMRQAATDLLYVHQARLAV